MRERKREEKRRGSGRKKLKREGRRKIRTQQVVGLNEVNQKLQESTSRDTETSRMSMCPRLHCGTLPFSGHLVRPRPHAHVELRGQGKETASECVQ